MLCTESLFRIKENPDAVGGDVGEVLSYIGTENIVIIIDATPRAVVRTVRVDDDCLEQTDMRVVTRFPRLLSKELHPSLPFPSQWKDKRWS